MKGNAYKKLLKARAKARGRGRPKKLQAGVPTRATKMVISSTPFPPMFLTLLKYEDTVAFGTGVATVHDYKFRSNDCYDLDLTGGGHQPRGFDQLCSSNGPYQKFLVLGTSFKCKLWNKTTNCPIIVKVITTNDTASISAFSTLAEQGQSTNRTFFLSGFNVGGDIRSFAFKVNPARVMGVSKSDYSDTNSYGGDYSQSPSQICTTHIVAQTADNTTLLTGYLTIEVELLVRFSDQLNIAGS